MSIISAPVNSAFPESLRDRARKCVLLVEDNPADVVLLAVMLEESPSEFRLESTATLLAAKERLQLGGVDLILCDLHLPDSRRDATVAALRDAACGVPIVVLSGLDDEVAALAMVECGAQDYLVKGRITNALLVRTMRYALERQRSQAELQRAHDELDERVTERTAELAQMTAQLRETLEQLQQAQQRIVQQERLRALGQMASGIAHDFNNSLAPIVGYTDLLLHSKRVSPAQATEYLQLIHTAARDSANVVSRLREFFRYRDEHDVFAPVMLNDLVRQVIGLTRPRWHDQALGRGVEIEVVAELQSVPAILGSESELRELLVNLIFNAADAVRGRGTIFCRTFCRDGAAVVQIADTGVGMSEKVRLRCFEPFFSTKAERGTGLGLAMVHGIVRRHEGEIEVVSAPGHGTTVSLTLLAFDDAVVPELAIRRPARSRPLRVLVVDDEPSVREILDACLTEEGHTTVMACDGREGMEKFVAGEWDVVLTDRAMPQMSGDVFAAAIKAHSPAMPVVLVTGFADLMQETGDHPKAIDVIVRKPFTLETLRTGIAQALALHPAAEGTACETPRYAVAALCT